MKDSIDVLITELTLKAERIVELEYTLQQLRSQLKDVHKEDSIIITIINNALKNN